MGVKSRSSCPLDSLSVENGVFISKRGLFSRCLEMRESLARRGARANEGRGLRQRRERRMGSRMTSANRLSTRSSWRREGTC